MAKRVLAAVDLGFDAGWENRARFTVENALVLAGALRLPVDLVHISDVPSGSAMHKGALELLKKFGSDQKQRLTEMAREKQLEQRVHPLFLQGQAVPKLIQLASKKAQYECLVLATHGRTGLQHVLLGSVAEKVVRLAPCPVLTVRHRG